MVQVNDFLEKTEERVLVIYLTPQSQLLPANAFPASSKTKVCIYIYVYVCTKLHINMHICPVGLCRCRSLYLVHVDS